MYTVHVLGTDGIWRAKIYRTASSWPIEEDVQDSHHRRHTWEVIVSGRAM
jgi:hypothetical protein